MKFALLALLLSGACAAFGETPLATWPLPEVPRGGNPAAIAAPRQEWIARAMKKAEEARKQMPPVQLLFDGDSITDWWQNGGREIWDARYVPLHAADFGCAADRTEHLLWRLEAGQCDGLDPKLVVLLIGTNNLPGNTPEEVAGGIREIVAQYEKRCPHAHILLLGLFPRGASPDDGMRAQLKAVNDLIAPLGDEKKVTYLDIGEKFLEPDGALSKEVMPDALHPSAKGYEIWADAIQPEIDKILPPVSARPL